MAATCQCEANRQLYVPKLAVLEQIAPQTPLETTRSPVAKPVTWSPTATTVPAASKPGVKGSSGFSW